MMFLHFVDDCICLLSPNPEDVEKLVADLWAAKFSVTDEGQLSDCLDVKIKKPPVQVLTASFD